MINDKFLKTCFTAILLTVSFYCVGATFASDNNGWQLAIEPRAWNFPRDHGAHPEYRTEWWYFTGNLSDNSGNRYGYQLTFFRQGLRTAASEIANRWSVRDVYIAHFTITDVAKGAFTMDERMSRAGPGLAGALTENLKVWLFNWEANLQGNTILLEARNTDMQLTLELRPQKPVVFHGDRGLSKKGAEKGQASYYTSFTDLKTSGSIRTGFSNSLIQVKGTSWFDHEFGSAQLAQDQEGWDWFGLHLADGRDLMIYLLRHTDKSMNPESAGTLVEPDGRFHRLSLSDMSVTVLDSWKSKKTKTIYPSTWRITVPAKQIEMMLTPLIANQELDTSKTTGIIYWEGAVAGQGMSRGKPTSCEGYVELTGYAGTMGGIF